MFGGGFCSFVSCMRFLKIVMMMGRSDIMVRVIVVPEVVRKVTPFEVVRLADRVASNRGWVLYGTVDPLLMGTANRRRIWGVCEQFSKVIIGVEGVSESKGAGG